MALSSATCIAVPNKLREYSTVHDFPIYRQFGSFVERDRRPLALWRGGVVGLLTSGPGCGRGRIDPISSGFRVFRPTQVHPTETALRSGSPVDPLRLSATHHNSS